MNLLNGMGFNAMSQLGHHHHCHKHSGIFGKLLDKLHGHGQHCHKNHMRHHHFGPGHNHHHHGPHGPNHNHHNHGRTNGLFGPDCHHHNRHSISDLLCGHHNNTFIKW